MKKMTKCSRRDQGKLRKGCNEERTPTQGETTRKKKNGQHQNEDGGELERSSRSDKKQTAQVGESVDGGRKKVSEMKKGRSWRRWSGEL